MSESPVWSGPATQVQISSPQPIHKWAKGRIFFAPGGEDSISFSPSCSLLKVISENNQDSLGGSLRPFYCSEFLLNGPSHRHQSVQISLAGVITSTCFCPGIKVAWGPPPVDWITALWCYLGSFSVALVWESPCVADTSYSQIEGNQDIHILS